MIERIYKQYRPSLLRFLSRYVGPEDAEDILHEVFLRYISSEKKQPILNIGAWLNNVARHLLIDRSRKKREAHLEKNTMHDHAADTLLEMLADETWASDYELQRKDIDIIIRKALTQLPSAQRYVIEMTEIEGKSFKELSIKVKTPVNTLLTRKHSGILTLRKLLRRFIYFVIIAII